MRKQRTKNNFNELVQDDLKALSMRPGSFIKGRIMSIEKNWITVDTRLKTEGRLPSEQFKNEEGNLEVKVGDEIELLLETVENGYGQTQVSYEKAKFIRLWEKYEEMHKTNSTVQGTIRHKVHGGFSVDLAGIRAFLPGSLIDTGNNMDPRILENTDTEFKIIKIDKERYNLVVSHRAIGRERLEDEKRSYFESLLALGKVRGTVKRLFQRGALIGLGKGVGFLRNLDIAWEAVHDPADHIQIGEEHEFKVIRYDEERNCLLLSLREMVDSPWDNLADNYKVGQELESIIRHINDHGLLVEIAPGLIGLVHTSELDWSRTPVNTSDYGKLGDTLPVKILSMEPEKRKLALSYRACLSNPWQEYADEHKIGDTVEGTIKDIYDFGVFVNLAECIDGFVHPRHLDWILAPNDAIKQIRKGQKTKCAIIGMDIDSRRILLSIKKTKPNYYAEYTAVHPVKALVPGKVKKIGKKNVVIELTDNVVGNLPIRELSSDKMKAPEDLVKMDQELQLQILHYDPKKRMIVLSLRTVTEGEEKEVLTQHKKKKTSFINRLGDLLHLGDRSKKAKTTEEQEEEVKIDTELTTRDKEVTKVDAEPTTENKEEAKADAAEPTTDKEETQTSAEPITDKEETQTSAEPTTDKEETQTSAEPTTDKKETETKATKEDKEEARAELTAESDKASKSEATNADTPDKRVNNPKQEDKHQEEDKA